MLLQHAALELRPRFRVASVLVLMLLTLGGWTARGLWRSEERRASQDLMPPQPAQPSFVPVPTSEIAVGARIGTVRFRMKAQPATEMIAGAIRDIADHRDSVALRALPAGEPIYARDLQSSLAAHNPIVERIPVGMRAMAIKVDATATVEGWAGSGSTVDVLLVEREHTSVIAERVRILSAERSLTPVNSETTPAVPATVTLLVTQEQCLAIAAAAPLGKIAFALRRADDEERWGAVRYTVAAESGSAANDKRRVVINGAAVVGGPGNQRSYALTDGRWIATAVTPQGFFSGR